MKIFLGVKHWLGSKGDYYDYSDDDSNSHSL